MTKPEKETTREELTDEQKKSLAIALDAHIRIPTAKKIEETIDSQHHFYGHEKFIPKTGKVKRIPTHVPLEKHWLPFLEACNNQILIIEYCLDPKDMRIEIIPCTQEQLDAFLKNLSEKQRTQWQPFLRLATVTQEKKLSIFFPKNTDELAIVTMAPYSFEIIPAERLVLTPERQKQLEEAMETIIALFDEITTQIPHEVYVALERGARTPNLGFPPLRIFRFSG
ncbi:hypothetical protein HZA41_03575, partial [Candidatus Peregrinibacteria bacterium]|nr:hypothetical protein [Candidatus Peregrinibacteria bacterium]